MNKTIYMLVTGAVLLSPVLAEAADVKIYGRANITLDYLDDGKNYDVFTVTSNASRLGFKVDHQLQNGMTAFAQIEQEINFATGTNDSKANSFATRDTFAGIRSDQYGQIRIGRFDGPFKIARSPINFFGDMLGDMRNLTRAGSLRFDERNDNTVEYKSPKFGNGFNVLAGISMQNGVQVNQQANGDELSDTKAYDIALTYKKGPFDLAAAYEKFEENASNSSATTARDAVRVAGAYKVSEALNIGGLYQNSKYDKNTANNVDAQIFGIAGEYKITQKTLVRGQYLYRDVDTNEANSSMIALGLEHKLDPAFRVYGNIATVLNDDNANLAPWREGRANANASSPILAAMGENAYGVSVGMRYDF